MEKLFQLKDLKDQTESLADLKQQIIHASHTLQSSKQSIESILTEKRLIEQEKNDYLLKLQQAEQDLSMLIELEAQQKTQITTSQQTLTSLFSQFDPLKDKVDELRNQLNLPKLPNIQEEIDQKISRYLEKRRSAAVKQEQTAALNATTEKPRRGRKRKNRSDA